MQNFKKLTIIGHGDVKLCPSCNHGIESSFKHCYDEEICPVCGFNRYDLMLQHKFMLLCEFVHEFKETLLPKYPNLKVEVTTINESPFYESSKEYHISHNIRELDFNRDEDYFNLINKYFYKYKYYDITIGYNID